MRLDLIAMWAAVTVLGLYSRHVAPEGLVALAAVAFTVTLVKGFADAPSNAGRPTRAAPDDARQPTPHRRTLLCRDCRSRNVDFDRPSGEGA